MKESSFFSLTGKKIVFSGATGVLGKAMAIYLAQEGAEVLILGRTAQKVDDLRDQILKLGGNAYSFYGDVTQEEDLQKVASSILCRAFRHEVDQWNLEREHRYLQPI